MLQIEDSIELSELGSSLEQFWGLSGNKILKIDTEYDHSKGSPVFTASGQYTTIGWTEWTQGRVEMRSTT